MKTLIAALAAFFLALTMAPASADAPVFDAPIAAIQSGSFVKDLDRTQHLTGLNPPSTWLNMEQRDNRIGIGVALWDMLSGANLSYTGQYAGCVTSPVTGLYVAVAPSGTVEDCAVYQLQAEEVTGYGGYPSGVGTYLPADTTQVVLQGLVPAGTSTANIGPMGVGSTSGQSIANLIECKIVTSDVTSQTVNIVSSGGSVSAVSANRDRVDRLSCQDKQSASATSPTTPTVDTGYVAISVVLVPFGTSTVTTGMISASTGQSFTGFLQPTVPGATAIDTSSTSQTKTGALTVGPTNTYDLYLPQSSCTGGSAAIGSANTVAVAGINASNFIIGCSSSTYSAVFDTAGDEGLNGTINTIGGLNVNLSTAAACITVGTSFSTTCPYFGNSSDGGANFSVAATSTLGYRFFTDSAGSGLHANVQFPPTNGIETGSTSAGPISYVPPMYTTAGAAVGGTAHSVYGSCTTSASNICTLSFSGAAVFSSNTSYACAVSSNANFVEYSFNLSTTSVSLGLSGASAGTYTIWAVCTGT